MGVAEGFTEMTDRTGKTRSVASGLRADSLGAKVGDLGVLVAPEKMLTEDVLGIARCTGARGTVVSGDGGSFDPERR
jgi:hypothetical protein